MNQIAISNETHALLKKYCSLKDEFLYQVASRILRDFLNGNVWHIFIESKGEMIIEEKDQEERKPRRSLKDIEIVRKDNRYIVKKKKPTLPTTH